VRPVVARHALDLECGPLPQVLPRRIVRPMPGRDSRRKLRIRMSDADVRRDERPRDESLRNQDGALFDQVVSSSDVPKVSATFFATRAGNVSLESESGFHSCVAEEFECARTISRSPLGEVVAPVQDASAVHRDLACLIGRARRSRRATPST
jgi:hypothetical protein